MTKQILAFLFRFIRELSIYSPLTLSLTPARELKPHSPPLPSPSPRARTQTLYSPLTFSLYPPIHPYLAHRPPTHPSGHPPIPPQPTLNPSVCPVTTVERMDV